jgi:uncharacterized membrane protein YtjA (UPF0391 family)
LGIGALVISIIAGALGFTRLSAGAAVVAKVLFGIFLVIALTLFLLVILAVIGIGAAAG